MTDFLKEYDDKKARVEAFLSDRFNDEDAPQKRLLDAMKYSLSAPGKRVRPIMTLKFAEACGADTDAVMPVACAVEMLHTYSLIHDDLPCMDNDTLRRGRPTNHVVFGEYGAVLAGDALQAAAFETILGAELPYDVKAKAALCLAKAAGEYGICGGQILDMDGEGKTLDIKGVMDIHSMKTASMIIACAEMGVIAGGGSEDQTAAAREYAEAVGLAFQIEDDILDVVSDAETMGKSVGTDEESSKNTFVSVYGIEKCRELIDELTEKAVRAVRSAFDDPEFLCELAYYLAKRNH